MASHRYNSSNTNGNSLIFPPFYLCSAIRSIDQRHLSISTISSADNDSIRYWHDGGSMRFGQISSPIATLTWAVYLPFHPLELCRNWHPTYSESLPSEIYSIDCMDDRGLCSASLILVVKNAKNSWRNRDVAATVSLASYCLGFSVNNRNRRWHSANCPCSAVECRCCALSNGMPFPL